MDTQSTSLIECHIFVKRGDILLRGDHEQVVAAQDEIPTAVRLQHLGVLGKALGALGIVAVEPQLAALVGLRGCRRDANGPFMYCVLSLP